MTAEEHREVRHRGWITAVVMAATVMHALDATIANVALPHMQGQLSATQDQISWVLTSYIVVSAIMTPLTGFLASRVGRRRLFFWAVTLFTIASMLCGVSQSLEQIVLFRALQGAFGAALIPLSQALLLDIYPPSRHSWAMAIWGVGVMVGPIMGPTLGGWLTDDFSWRWVFYINVPVGILAGIGILVLVRDGAAVARRPFDLMGFALLGIGIGAVQMMLDRGELLDWFDSTEIVIEAAIAALALAMCLIHLFTTRTPFVDLRLFEDRNFNIGLLLTATAGMIMIASAAIMPPFLQGLRGYPAIDVGLIMAPRGIGMMVSMLMVARLIAVFDQRLVMGVGFTIGAASIWPLTQSNLDIAMSTVLWSGVVQGFGLGFVFVPLSTVMFATTPPALRTDAAAMNALVRNLGGSIGIAVMVATLTSRTQLVRAELTENVNVFNPAWNAAAVGGERVWAMWDVEITRQAAMIAYLVDFKLMMYYVVATIPLLFLLKRTQRR